ncbi:MAG: ATP-binding cassette domain-containing protein [Crocinitomicaceae bacterium]|nr:ATP-binding cassette domain-containing protein [Flavobacteriales bacterium]NQZ35284.1 ATP-binding cassette domain-containing protein [Crocinitomicaceae bacterium]
MGEKVLSIKSLSKNYKSFAAVNDISFDVERQMVFGLLGPNGSGKTTTLGMLMGVIRPSGGDFSWFENGQNDENRKRIGSLLETPNFYPYLTAKQNLEIVAKIKGVDSPDAAIESVLKTVGLYDRRDSKFRTYSLGMKQRLAIGSTLLGDPEVLVLDEPTNGLDPQGIAEIRELIIRIGKSGKTIIIASHILDEIQKICTHCAILRKGKLLQVSTIDHLIGNQDVRLIKVGAGDMSKVKTIVSAQEDFSIYKEEKETLILRCTKETTAEKMNQFFYEKGIILNELSVFNESLENQFLEIIKKS